MGCLEVVYVAMAPAGPQTLTALLPPYLCQRTTIWWLKQQTFILSLSWRPEVQGQGIPSRVFRKRSFLPLPVSGGPLASLGLWPRLSNLCLSLHMASPCVSVSSLCLQCLSAFLRDTSHWIYGPPEQSRMNTSSQDP